MTIENSIDIDKIKKTLKEFIRVVGIISQDIDGNQIVRKHTCICISLILSTIWIIAGIFYDTFLEGLQSINDLFSSSEMFIISLIYLFARAAIILVISFSFVEIVYDITKTRKNKNILNKNIDNVSSYQDIVNIIIQIRHGCNKNYPDKLDKLKQNLDDYLWLINNKIIDTEISTCAPFFAKGSLLVAQETENGNIRTRIFDVKVEQNSLIDEKKLIFTAWDEIKLVIPCKEGNTPALCCYCGKPLDIENRHNADDYNLHNETHNKSCCEECYNLITITNRYLSKAIYTSPELRHNYIL